MVPVALTEAEWSPFGWLPVADVDPRDGKETLTFEWADAHVNLIGHARAEVPETPAGLRCEMLFRHDTHTQALMPLNVPAVIVVAPADVEFADQDKDQAQADRASIRAFRIEPLESLVLHRGTWHWGPFPLEGPEVRLFNVQGLRYAEDNRCVDLASKELAVEVEVVTAPPDSGASGGA
jgi:ureidoglycolate hydrolase